ncbi:hypothetical protein [Lysobacter gummosus]|uniref:hypothetical protein n=1 Tax=Lysobacter gummosus TaxID=262324 RepID=UPI0036278EDE
MCSPPTAATTAKKPNKRRSGRWRIEKPARRLHMSSFCLFLTSLSTLPTDVRAF